ncbi:MAG: tetratricopeptide repeat protein [Polyangiaceae bacterium]
MALGRADDALVWLRAAYAGAAGSNEVAASYAHALARSGRIEDAKKILAKALKRTPSRENEALWQWLEAGAQESGAGAPIGRPTSVGGSRGRRLDVPRTSTKKRPSPGDLEALEAAFDEALSHGLGTLPLDTRQRSRARTLARDATPLLFTTARGAKSRGDGVRDPRVLAAAVAYAIVYVDQVPLTPAEVAASFRVSVAGVRGTFGELRSEMDLVRGDERYGSR